MKTTHTALIHGESKIGKSWLCDTIPAPRLILDSEGRAKYTPSGPKVYWNPREGGPPRYDGTWETCIAAVPDYETMSLAYPWIRGGQHDFKSVGVDSLMEVQKRCIDQEVGVRALQIQDWGNLLRELESLVRKYRDITLYENNPLSVVVFVVGTQLDDGVQRPLLQGSLRNTVPYYLDTIGYLYKTPQLQPDGTNKYIRSLLIDSIPGFTAGDGTGKLPGPVIFEPNFAEMFSILEGNPTTEEVASV